MSFNAVPRSVRIYVQARWSTSEHADWCMNMRSGHALNSADPVGRLDYGQPALDPSRTYNDLMVGHSQPNGPRSSRTERLLGARFSDSSRHSVRDAREVVA